MNHVLHARKIHKTIALTVTKYMFRPYRVFRVYSISDRDVMIKINYISYQAVILIYA